MTGCRWLQQLHTQQFSGCRCRSCRTSWLVMQRGPGTPSAYQVTSSSWTSSSSSRLLQRAAGRGPARPCPVAQTTALKCSAAKLGLWPSSLGVLYALYQRQQQGGTFLTVVSDLAAAYYVNILRHARCGLVEQPHAAIGLLKIRVFQSPVRRAQHRGLQLQAERQRRSCCTADGQKIKPISCGFVMVRWTQAPGGKHT